MKLNLENMLTESPNPSSAHIEQCSTLEMVKIINQEDKKVALAIEKVLPQIAQSIDQIADRLRSGGRLIYQGAGTSGRLGVIDAAECPPTFNTDPGQVIGVLAGGDKAIRIASEGIEDSVTTGIEDLKKINLNQKDALVGISASGRTPYVLGGLSYAREVGALCIGLSCNENTEISEASDIKIEVWVGPEVITGSTRMKAGSAQKMVLNMISTGVMIRLGKTYGNWMVDVKPTNHKLRLRARHIVKQICQLSESQAEQLLEESDWDVKTAVVSGILGSTPAHARYLLKNSDGSVRGALEMEKKDE